MPDDPKPNTKPRSLDLPDEDLPDEDLPEPLDLGPLDGRAPLPPGEELLDEDELPEAARSTSPVPELASLGADAQEELLDAPGPGEELPDEGHLGAPWLSDDGLAGALDEEDLVEPTPRPPVDPCELPVAGVEELVSLVDLGPLAVPATLATGMAESVLSGPLRSLDDGRVRLRLGSSEIQADPRGFATRLRLGGQVIPVTLRLVDGPSLRLVVGREVLSGRVLVDPSRRFLLSSAVRDPDPLADDPTDELQ